MKDKISTLEKSIARLSILQLHDALCLLKNSVAMPKLLYILRTSPCANNPLLHEFNIMLKVGLETILNVQLSESQWMESCITGSPHGQQSWSEKHMHTGTVSLFLASAATTLPLQDAILALSLAGVDNIAVSIAKTSWCDNHRASWRVQAHPTVLKRLRHNRCIQQSAYRVFFTGRPGQIESSCHTTCQWLASRPAFHCRWPTPVRWSHKCGYWLPHMDQSMSTSFLHLWHNWRHKRFTWSGMSKEHTASYLPFAT